MPVVSTRIGVASFRQKRLAGCDVVRLVDDDTPVEAAGSRDVMLESRGGRARLSPASLLLEKRHVYDVYKATAPRFANKFYRPWLHVVQFLQSLEPGAIVADVGCGNGRYLQIRPDIFVLGGDRCSSLVDIAHSRGGEAVTCCNLVLPYRDASCDAVLSIAVIHHFASRERRVRALRELARVLRPGGRLLIYVGAIEHKVRSTTGPDVLVLWNLPDSSVDRPSDFAPTPEAVNSDVINGASSRKDSLSDCEDGETPVHCRAGSEEHLEQQSSVNDVTAPILTPFKTLMARFSRRKPPRVRRTNHLEVPEHHFEKTQSEEIGATFSDRLKGHLANMFRKTRSADDAAGDHRQPSLDYTEGSLLVTSQVHKDRAYQRLITRIAQEDLAAGHGGDVEFAVREFPGSSVDTSQPVTDASSSSGGSGNLVATDREAQLEVVRDVLLELENKTGTDKDVMAAFATVKARRSGDTPLPSNRLTVLEIAPDSSKSHTPSDGSLYSSYSASPAEHSFDLDEPKASSHKAEEPIRSSHRPLLSNKSSSSESDSKWDQYTRDLDPEEKVTCSNVPSVPRRRVSELEETTENLKAAVRAAFGPSSAMSPTSTTGSDGPEWERCTQNAIDNIEKITEQNQDQRRKERKLVKQSSLMIDSQPSSPACAKDSPAALTNQMKFEFNVSTDNDSGNGESTVCESSTPKDRKYKRYYHMFRNGELEELIRLHVPELHVVETFYEECNWCVLAEKVRMWSI